MLALVARHALLAVPLARLSDFLVDVPRPEPKERFQPLPRARTLLVRVVLFGLDLGRLGGFVSHRVGRRDGPRPGWVELGVVARGGGVVGAVAGVGGHFDGRGEVLGGKGRIRRLVGNKMS